LVREYYYLNLLIKEVNMGGPTATNNPYDEGDLGRMGESHRPDGAHHTLYRPGTRISWDTDAEGNYVGGGHTVEPDGKITQWSPAGTNVDGFDPT